LPEPNDRIDQVRRTTDRRRERHYFAGTGSRAGARSGGCGRGVGVSLGATGGLVGTTGGPGTRTGSTVIVRDGPGSVPVKGRRRSECDDDDNVAGPFFRFRRLYEYPLVRS
jgi:hypothetical protein